ncbi:unnamed protein product [Closterium sp. Naga37s-1]|nr:unnamed protein product [Closterium sp. Naga37s-1]
MIDKIKEAVEAECPGVVSCADIVALAARDGVVMAGGPYIDTQLGRRDSRSSRASRAEAAMPGHRMNVDELLKNFAAVNLTRLDLVTLSGAHTIGDAHCGSVEHRIAPNHDSTMAKSLREKLNDQCRAPNVEPSKEVNLDFKTKNRFDNKGCDGSILLKSTAGNQAEMDAPPNLSLHGYDIIDRIKEAVEAKCPGVVSCADIVTLASRDAVKLAGGPFWPVDMGRRDSRTSSAALASTSMPGHQMNVNALLRNFAAANLTLVDLVTLAGAHTIGDASCGSVAHRLAPNSDPSMAPQLRDYLNGQCKAPNVDEKIFVLLDSSSGSTFDNHNLQRKFGLLSSDQVLAIDSRTKQLVNRYASDRGAFFRQFSHSMIRMGEAGVLTGTQGEIRRTCSAVN